MSGAPERGVLYVVATPIGHLGDLSPRAAETLRNAARVAAEDTRRSRGLLTHLGITGKPVDRLDAHASAHDVARVVDRLLAGEDVALVTDAGTPVVSDPGTDLVRAAAEAGVRVVPIPGPSAVMAALSASGLCTGAFRFLGFLPRKGPERRDALELVRATPESVVLFESPERTAETLADLATSMPNRSAAVARELTKVHEEILRGTLPELARVAAERETLGEVTIVIGPGEAPKGPLVGEEELDRLIDEHLARGRRPKDIADELALVSGRPRRELYARVLARKRDER
ncbi:16S rRNA (cytidine(1402)-2'-O)-methyltransferase [Polyangium sp. y55x31]|uniref:16S rRNA (cytidine(1402)-2'-O)-methyltransferase n=1 Tax=Polyangium sp. y55x31 TaxID=3042688 RepID=UPI0024832CF9|nr:16S rRNA (cytidine(1402)-2'-O)-methyltransferase [Polyangium sp. y55x31]MDI1476944.1 16S rRNA (cytidine(1402)-2'-O)-methyltransferase [Polyangium sp. y55x31]